MTAVDATSASPAAISEVLAALRPLLGTRVTSAEAVREHHSKGESYHPPRLPDIVAFPHNGDEVGQIVSICAARQVPLVAFGAGTSVEGQVGAVRGGVSVDVSQMNRVLAVNADDLDAVVEAGVTHRQLNHHLRNSGLFFSVDPGADATLGGMAATRASGTTTVRYGSMRENVMGLTVVLASGRTIKTGGRARKSAAGYDLTRLFVGSEGTLGIITELTVRLHPLPEACAVSVCSFETIHDAVNTVIATLQVGISAARVELMDDIQMNAVNRYSRLEHAVAPTLFFEFHGANEREVAERAATVESIAADNHGTGFRSVTRPEDRSRLWQARHDAYYAALALRPGSKALTTDVCVPISRLADCILQTKEDLATSFLTATLVGHVGDGNFHTILLIDPDRPEELAEARRLADRMVTRALALGGTCTGEHGIGLGKIQFLAAEHGESVDAMRSIKAALDPDNLMNPGKLFAG